MTDAAPATGKEVAVARAVIPVSFDKTDARAMYLDTGVFEQLQRVAMALSKSALVPQHLREKPADCLLVTAQAMRWNADPLVVAQHSYVTPQGRLGYEGKLAAAVVNAALDEELSYEYSNVGGDRKVVVSGTFGGKVRTVEGFVSKWKTSNKQWTDDPDQMLAYRGARQWARRHMPHLLLGVQAGPEDAQPDEMIDITNQSRVVAVADAISGPPAAELGRRKRRTREEIEADDAAAAERAALVAAGQKDMLAGVEPAPKVVEADVVEIEPVPDDDPLPTEPEAEPVETTAAEDLATAAVSEKQREWMAARLNGLDELTGAKAVGIMDEKMRQQIKSSAPMLALWDKALKAAKAKFN